ncbi:MAG: ABC transporter ATP-binding protein [Alphaproteobacteria bacterium]|nr:ABC transporter ATP-binding protein [Alphaproteobacteria bacterium]
MSPSPPTLVVRDLVKSFGGPRVLDRCGLRIQGGSITGLIGPNGAGKTTLFNVISGFTRPESGRVFLGETDITGLPPHSLFRAGLVRTFQIPNEFSRMTVLDNLMVVPGFQSGETLATALFRPGRILNEERALRRRAEEALAFLKLDHLATELAGNLSGGQKKLLELGRVIMSGAKTVLLDEPGAGVNRTLLATLVDEIRRLNRDRGVTFCVIEHDMDLVARICDPVIVMAEGRVMTEGSLDEVRRDAAVIDAYLGGRADTDGGGAAA